MMQFLENQMRYPYYCTLAILTIGAIGCSASVTPEDFDSSDTDTFSTDDSGTDSDSSTDTFADDRCGENVTPNAIPFEHPPWQPFEDMPECQHVAVVKDCTDGWCRIPKGCFVMGSPYDQWGRAPRKEDPLTVILDQNFEIMQFEVTRAQWLELGFEIPDPYVNMSGFGMCEEDNCPIVTVSWWAAIQFANAMSIRDGFEPCYAIGGCTGEIYEQVYDCTEVATTAPTLYECEGYRLPTEAEWEYAARAGTQTGTYLGPVKAPEDESLNWNCHYQPYQVNAAWYCCNADGHSHPVGNKVPNQWGLYDVLGNVFEWTNELGYNLPEGPVHNLWGTLDPPRDEPYTRVGRGCGFLSGPACIISARYSKIPGGFARSDQGLRLVRTLPE